MPNKEEGMPLQGTMEMVGATPEAVENKAESREYRDIGDQRLAAAGERLAAAGERVRSFFGKIGSLKQRAWERVKGFGSSAKETGKAALSYTLAAPEMARDVASGVKEELVQGGQFVAERARETYGNAKDLAAEGASRAFEGAVTAYDTTKEGVVWVGDKAKGAYEGALKFGNEKWEGLRQRAEDARGVFRVAVEEARRRRTERLASKAFNEGYEAARRQLEEAQRTVSAYEATFRQA